MGIPSTTELRARSLLPRTVPFFSGRKVELDEVIEPILEMPSDAALQDVPEQPSPPEKEEANDNDQNASNEAATGTTLL